MDWHLQALQTISLMKSFFQILVTFSKTFNFNFRRDHQKKFPVSVATMSRLTKRAYLRLYLEKRRKKEFRR